MRRGVQVDQKHHARKQYPGAGRVLPFVKIHHQQKEEGKEEIGQPHIMAAGEVRGDVAVKIKKCEEHGE